MAFLTNEQLERIGFKSFGDNVLISEKVSIYSPKDIVIGSNVRIDDFCILSGKITLHNYIHISAFSALYGKFEIEMEDFTGMSPRVTVFSASDDFSGESMISPMVPSELSNVIGGKVHIKKYSQIGSGSILMPNLSLEEGTVIGAMSLVKNSTLPWSINVGIPCAFLKERSDSIIELSQSIQRGK